MNIRPCKKTERCMLEFLVNYDRHGVGQTAPSAADFR